MQVTSVEPFAGFARAALMARSDIVVPGEDLQQAADSMRRVLQHINVKRSSADFNRVVGSPVRGAAESFEDRWDSGRKQLREECDDILKAIDMVLETFTSVDDQAGDSIGGGR
ncbi:hypothetical protein [Mangrovihabitans endophyticus]|uniref:Uncharacterized protein n=1 Tax=Mangrovihabitans endophyticus TaxID=1751298 RepID=A0A8J3BTQ8_9ACTN|nr:hypothetical protein [Mangrovihabitans endophyticus]GGK76305.1 hypothetical protein GCM10012284_07820 [Mangrovihabitans endophyticus]